MTNATLGFTVDSGGLPKAIADLDSLPPAAARAEAALDKLSERSSQSSQKTTSGLEKMRSEMLRAANDIESLSMRIDRALNIGGMGNSARESMSAFSAEIDRLRGKFVPLYAEGQRYKETVNEIRRAHLTGVITADQMSAAIERERQAMLRLRDAQRGVGGGAAPGRGQANALSSNLMYQFQDIGVTAAMGMSPAMIALQQGTQIGASLTASGGAKAGIAGLTGAVGQLLSTTNLFAIAATFAGAAAIQWFTSSSKEAKSLGDVQKEHLRTITDLAKAYNIAGVSAEDFARKSRISAEAAERRSRAELERTLRDAGREFAGQTTPLDLMTFGMLGTQEGTVDARFADFAAPILKLRKEIRDGKPDYEGFQKTIEQIANTKEIGGFRSFVDSAMSLVGLEPEGLRKTADELLRITDAAAEANAQLEKTERIASGRSGRLVGPAAMEDAAQRGRELLEQQRRERELSQSVEFQRMRDQAAAQIQSINARSPEERAAAARAAALASGSPGESPAVRSLRAELAAAQALAQANHTLQESARQRAISMRETLDSQKLELDLVGRTAGEAARLREEYRLTSTIKAEAARNGIEASEEELALARKVAEIYGQQADALARKNLASTLDFERRQLGRSPADADIAARLRGAGLPEDLGSVEAGWIRVNQQLERQKDIWREITQVGSSAIDSLMDSALDGFENLDDTLRNIARSLLREILMLGAANPLKNMLFGTSLPTFADMKGGGGLFGRMLGGGTAAAPTGGMSVPANDNLFSAPLGAVQRAPLASVQNMAGGSIESYIRQAAAMRSIDPDIAVRVARSEGGLKDPFRQGEAMLSYGREQSYGPFQLHMRQGGVGTRALAAGIDPRKNWQGGVDYALDEAANRGWGQWFGAAKAGIGNREGLEGARALGQFTKATQDATNVVKGFDTGIGKVAESLVGGAGTGAGGLGGLFGLGLSNLGAGFNPTRTGFMDMLGGGASAGAGGGGGFFGGILKAIFGMFGFANGTEGAPEGWAWVGERGPELRKLRAGDIIRSNQRSREMATGEYGGRGTGSVFAPVFQIDARESVLTEDQIERIVKRHTQVAVAQYDKQQRQGGFGDMQAQYVKQKG